VLSQHHGTAEESLPPGSALFTGQLGMPDQIAFADNAEQPLLIIDHRNAADMMVAEQLGDLMDCRLGRDRDDGGRHDIRSGEHPCLL